KGCCQARRRVCEPAGQSLHSPICPCALAGSATTGVLGSATGSAGAASVVRVGCSATGAGGGGGGDSDALKNASNSPKVRSGTAPLRAACDNLGSGAERRGLRGCCPCRGGGPPERCG